MERCAEEWKGGQSSPTSTRAYLAHPTPPCLWFPFTPVFSCFGSNLFIENVFPY